MDTLYATNLPKWINSAWIDESFDGLIALHVDTVHSENGGILSFGKSSRLVGLYRSVRIAKSVFGKKYAAKIKWTQKV